MFAAVVAAAVLAALAAAAVAVQEDGDADADAAMLRKFRQMVWDACPEWIPAPSPLSKGRTNMGGWRPDHPDHPCDWYGVKCNKNRHVTAIEVAVMHSSNFVPAVPRCGNTTRGPAIPLPPELAQLQWLDKLALIMEEQFDMPAIPAQWVSPGAFPRLTWLTLSGRLHPSREAPLPALAPGVLPRLEMLHLEFRGPRVLLPPSWGAAPAVLPALRSLMVSVHLEGSLPEVWSQGFRQLTTLHLINVPSGLATVRPSQEVTAPAIAAWRATGEVDTQAPALHPLPAAWAAPGAFPRLELLGLHNLAAGSLPNAWAAGGFPSLSALDISHSDLTGTLPRLIFERHPQLATLSLEGNRLTGTLPGAWGAAEVLQWLSVANNSLSGGAFPPAWLRPGAMPELLQLDLSGNAGLDGTLPAKLSWPRIKDIKLQRTALTGSVPSSWCQAPFAYGLHKLELKGTEVAGRLPECAAQSFPQLLGESGEQRPVSGGNCSWAMASLGVASLAALLPLAALVAAGVTAGRVLWRRRMRQRTSLWDQELLLRRDQQRSGSSGTGLRPPAHPPSAAGSSGERDSGRDRCLLRITGLLQAVMRDGRPLEMLPLDDLTPRLAHDFGPGQGATPCQPWGHEEGRARRACGMGASGGDGAGAANNGSTHAVASNRRWGLDSLSLRLQPGELELVTDAQGNAVVLGAGAQAAVYLGRMQEGNPVAVKVFELGGGIDSHNVWHEVAVLRRCVHQRILPLYGVAVKGQVLMLVMAFMRGGSLQKALQCTDTKEKLRWDAGGRQVALDIGEGLHFLHTELRVLHGDLKPSNVLLTQDLRACLGDLGVSQVVHSSACTIRACSPLYAAPEQLMGERCTLAADLFSFGVILIQLITRTVTGQRGTWRLPHVPAECSQSTRELIDDCIQKNPALRPTAEQALRRLRAEDACAEC